MIDSAFLSSLAPYVPMVLRVALGIVILPHGLQKLLGWYGGHGAKATVSWFGSIGVPSPVAWLVILAESFGSLGLILGFLTRFSAFGTLCVMLGAVFMVHAKVGFFMNWYGKQQGEGYEYHLLAIAMAVSVMLTGPGPWAMDNLW